MRRRLVNWLRDRTINLLIDCLCWVLPADQRYKLIIEPWREDGAAIAAIFERPLPGTKKMAGAPASTGQVRED